MLLFLFVFIVGGELLFGITLQIYVGNIMMDKIFVKILFWCVNGFVFAFGRHDKQSCAAGGCGSIALWPEATRSRRIASHAESPEIGLRIWQKVMCTI
jgi:hypothetical protein